MRKLFTVLAAVILAASVWAQSPEKMSYQAVVRNAGNELVTNQVVGMQISILPGSETGTPVFVETHTPTTNSNGLVTLEIGGGTAVTGTFEGIEWSTGIYFIKTETDPAGGTDYTITGTSQLLSVPYALYADSSGKGFSGSYNDLSDQPALFDGTWNSITGKPTTVAGYGISNAVTTTGNQTIADTKTFTGTTVFTGRATVASPVNTTDAATKDYVDAIAGFILGQLSSKGVIVADVDGNIYSTVRIGSQVWMAENLKTTKCNDGTAIPNVTDAEAWGNLSTPGYCWYNNDQATYGNTYGALYNWYTVGTGNLCPTGWHVPTDAEWTILTDYLGGLSVAGGKLKETGTTHWNSPNTGATNETGFTALPGGERYIGSEFYYVGDFSEWWSATETGEFFIDAWVRDMNYESCSMGRRGTGKRPAFSVRCLRD